MSENSIATLVDLIAVRARVDTTSPDAPNLRSGWRTDALLNDVDALVVGDYDNPAAYAIFGSLLLAKIGHLPEMAVLVQLAIFRGQRLLELTPERQNMLVRMAEELDPAVAALPEGPRKMRCASLLNYHKAIFFDACGRFDLAAGLQRDSALDAEHMGDAAGAAIARFCEARDLLKNALCKGESETALGAMFSRLEDNFSAMSKALEGHTLQVQWAEANGPAHMLEACVWLDLRHHDWGAWLELNLTACEKLGEAWKLGADLSRAIDAAMHGKPLAHNLLSEVARKSQVNEKKATAQLAVVRLLLRAGEKNGAKALVANMPVIGAQHVRAVAERLIAS